MKPRPRAAIRFLAPAVMGCLAAMAAGCGGGPVSGVVPVAGVVTVDGKPAANAVVTLHPVGGGEGVPRPSGRADADGRFALTSFAARDGAPPGEYRVTVAWYQAPPRPSARAGEGDDVPPRKLLPPAYYTPDATPVRATVAAGQTDPLAIAIKRR